MKNGNKEYICPNCGKKHTLVLVSTASAQFEIHPAALWRHRPRTDEHR